MADTRIQEAAELVKEAAAFAEIRQELEARGWRWSLSWEAMSGQGYRFYIFVYHGDGPGSPLMCYEHTAKDMMTAVRSAFKQALCFEENLQMNPGRGRRE